MKSLKPEDIKKLRESLGLTQSQLAEKLGYGAQSRIAELENGTRRPGPAVKILLKQLKEKAV